MTEETPEQIEQRELRALLATKQAEQAAPPVRRDEPPVITKGLAPGDQVHFTASGLMLRTGGEVYTSSSVIGQRSQTITLTAKLIEANARVFDVIDDPDEQVRRWGEPKVARGPAPEGMLPWPRGSVEEDIAREHALLSVWQLPEGDERNRKLEEVHRIFGHKKTSQTIAQMGFEK